MGRIAILFLWAVAGATALGQKDWARYQVDVVTQRDAQRLADSPLALFSEQIALPTTDVVVGPGEYGVLRQLGLSHKYVATLPDPRAWAMFWPDGDDYRTSYLRYDAMIAQYEQWRATYPNYIQRFTIGTSIQGRPIYTYRITAASAGQRPRNHVVIVGNTHAREWIATSVPMHITERLLNGIDTSTEIRGWMRRVVVHVVPSLNPDGYEYSHTNNRLWRKNRRANAGGTFGVDLNRNYSVGWGGQGSSSNPSSDVYRGTAPFSEPELQALRNYAQSLTGLVGFIDWHSYGEKILYPWSYTTSPAPGGAWHQQVADSMKASMIAAGGHPYTTGQGSTTLYIAGGTSKDWFYSVFNAVSYTVEMRDTGQNGFLLPESEIIPTQDECWAGFWKFLTLVATN